MAGDPHGNYGHYGYFGNYGNFADYGQQAEAPFAEAHIYVELNNTDGDLGFHALIDGEPWKRLTIEDIYERRILSVSNRGRLRRQGLTELFFESAEPPFDELTPEQFFKRFPEGIYEVEAKMIDGGKLESEVVFTHVMPAPPANSSNWSAPSAACRSARSNATPTR